LAWRGSQRQKLGANQVAVALNYFNRNVRVKGKYVCSNRTADLRIWIPFIKFGVLPKSGDLVDLSLASSCLEQGIISPHVVVYPPCVDVFVINMDQPINFQVNLTDFLVRARIFSICSKLDPFHCWSCCSRLGRCLDQQRKFQLD
jgi:hypothetical protein